MGAFVSGACGLLGISVLVDTLSISMQLAYDSLTSTLPKTASANSCKRSDDFDDVGHIVGSNI